MNTLLAKVKEFFKDKSLRKKVIFVVVMFLMVVFVIFSMIGILILLLNILSKINYIFILIVLKIRPQMLLVKKVFLFKDFI
jgi:hypothetical protein